MSNDPRQNEELATQQRARLLGFDYVDTSGISDKQLYKGLLDVTDIRSLRIVPLKSDSQTNLFGITTTTPQSSIRSVSQRFLDQRNSFVLISDSGFNEYLRLFDPPKKIVYQDIQIKDTGSDQLVASISAILSQVKADDMLAYLVSQAHRLNASDIHIETQTEDIRIRFRIDGVLHVIAKITPDKYRVLMAAIASAGNISTSSKEAQQGHIAQKVNMADNSVVDVNVRLMTVPTINGIDVVMRLFNMDASRYSLDRLGLSVKERQVVDQIIAQPSGLVMAVGPTGSGKTTTLYSILNSLNNESRKIITVEDPVEYQIKGVTQISVNTNDQDDRPVFAEQLRAVLRLDPDIVMVGEVRDNDTARTALQASLTGHLVLTTFHASSAAAALTRLADIIGQNPLFVSSIRLIMAQRLVRRLDDTTKQAYTATEAELSVIKKVIDTIPELSLRPNLDNLQLYNPGSSETNPYGFSGQLALREQLMMSDRVRALIMQTDSVVSTQDIEAAAVQDGMMTMLQDAMLKVVAGETTLAEVYRVLG